MHRLLHIHIQSYTHNHTHTYIYIYIHIHTYFLQVYTFTYTNTYMHKYAYTYIIVLDRCSADRTKVKLHHGCHGCHNHSLEVTILTMDPQHTAMEQAALKLLFPKNYALFDQRSMISSLFPWFWMGVTLLHFIALATAMTCQGAWSDACLPYTRVSPYAVAMQGLLGPSFLKGQNWSAQC